MTEIERLKADLATLEKAKEVAATLDGGFSDFRFRTLIDSLKQNIADLEAQQEPADEWADSRMFVQEILADSSFPQRLIWLARYARHLESKVAELDHELRCERIDGGKVRDDLKAEIAELKAKAKREQLDLCEECGYPLSDCGPLGVDGTPTTDCKACQHRAKTTDWAWAKHLTSVFLHHRYDGENIWLLATYAKHLEEQLSKATIRNFRTVEQLRETLAELTTIQNAIPPACGLARELVEKRIEGVKLEIQNNGN